MDSRTKSPRTVFSSTASILSDAIASSPEPTPVANAGPTSSDRTADAIISIAQAAATVPGTVGTTISATSPPGPGR